MAIKLTRKKEPRTTKNVSTNKKKTLSLVQDLKYARSLADNNEKVRNKALKYLKGYLQEKSETGHLSERSLEILWKGLFYSMWMSDRPLVQEQCATDIAELIHCLKLDHALQFFQIGMTILENEWFGLDQFRMNKFKMLVRRLLRQALFVLKNNDFEQTATEAFGKILGQTILSPTVKSIGLFMFFTEIYLEELAKVADEQLQPHQTVAFLKPYITRLAFATDPRALNWINKFIFTHLMKQHELGLEYEEKYRVWKDNRFAGSINDIKKVELSDESENEETDEEDQQERSTEDKPLDPRAGRVDVELPPIVFDAEQVSEAFLVHKTDPKTTKKSRNHLKMWSEKFLKLHNGIYPLGIKQLEPRKQKQEVVEMNPTKAAKKLIKFQQRLLAKEGKQKGKKRKADEAIEEEAEIEQATVATSNDAKTRSNPHIFTFERSSGVFQVTPILDHEIESAQPLPGPTEHLSPKKRKLSQTPETEQKSSPPSKVVKKLKQSNKVTKVVSKLRGKNRLKQAKNLKVRLNRLKVDTEGPKKVKINTKLNVSQDIEDHIFRVQSSPQIPWDSAKKPGKPVLKTPIKSSPINPFYKLKLI